MTNSLVGDVYDRIIEEVIAASADAFEENGVPASALQTLRETWQAELSKKQVAQMPWDPKPEPVPQPPPPVLPLVATNGLPPPPYPAYDAAQPSGMSGAAHVKEEPSTESKFHPLQNGYAPQNVPQEGGIVRAQQLLQQYSGQTGNARPQAVRGGLALPGQQMKSQAVQLPAASQQQAQQQYAQRQQMQAAQQRQQAQLQQQQMQPRIKMETRSPPVKQESFAEQKPPQAAAYGQTDGADDSREQWQVVTTLRRGMSMEQTEHADRTVRNQILQLSARLESGLMMPLDEQPKRRKGEMVNPVPHPSQAIAIASPSIPQMDGDGDEEDLKVDMKEDDEDAINSDLDDSDDNAKDATGDDDEECPDGILCTYDKVQRVKNKWKCTLKDGVMVVGGKEWVFHKGTGEFEW